MKKFLLSSLIFISSLNLMSIFILLGQQGFRTGVLFFIMFLLVAIISLFTTFNYWQDLET